MLTLVICNHNSLKCGILILLTLVRLIIDLCWRRIPCACVVCTSMLYKTWISGIPTDKKERYKPVTKCTYWPVLGPFKNWKIIQQSHKSTPYDAFDEIHQVVLDGLSDNMASLFEPGTYGAINTNESTTHRLYVIMLISEAYKLQDNTTIDRKIIDAVKLVFKVKYLCSTQLDTNWY